MAHFTSSVELVCSQRRLRQRRLRGGTAELARVRKRDRKSENMCLEGENPLRIKPFQEKG